MVVAECCTTRPIGPNDQRGRRVCRRSKVRVVDMLPHHHEEYHARARGSFSEKQITKVLAERA